MYNLAKLLTEEPEKLERLGILFLKLLITLLICSTLFGFNISIYDFVEKPIPREFNLIKLILFISSLIIVWLIVWNIIGELIFGELIIWGLSFIGKDKFVFEMFIEMSGQVKIKQKEYYPNNNTIHFSKFLNTYNRKGKADLKKDSMRIKQYFILISIIFLTLLLAKDIILPNWLIWAGLILIVNSLIGCVLVDKTQNYISSNIEELNKKFKKLSYAQMIINSLDNNQFVKIHYDRTGHWERLRLERKTDEDSLPKSIKIIPFIYWNDLLSNSLISNGLSKRSDIKNIKSEGCFDIIISDIKPNNENIINIQNQQNIAYLYCKNEKEISKSIEVLFYKISDGNYALGI